MVNHEVGDQEQFHYTWIQDAVLIERLELRPPFMSRVKQFYKSVSFHRTWSGSPMSTSICFILDFPLAAVFFRSLDI